MRISGLLLIGSAFLFSSVSAMAAPADIARRFADEFAVPRFQAVAIAAHAQDTAWTAFCAARKRGNPTALKQAYENLSDAWSDVEFVRIGPAALALRVERFNWWLDRTDATGKTLTAMLAAKPQDLTVEKLAAGSVAGQGLPIIERLLYPVSEIARLKTKEGAQRCVVGEAVAREQSAIADQIVADWTAPDGARKALTANKAWKSAFADANEAASVMMTDLVAGLEGLKDLKVAMEFHDIMNPKAVRLSEDSRSGRTVRDISRNLVAIRQGLAIFMATATPAEQTQLDAAFEDAARALKDLDAAKTDTARTNAAKQALAVFGTLSQTAMTVLPQATGLTLGFNNLDGD
jgi:hypothetical protein